MPTIKGDFSAFIKCDLTWYSLVPIITLASILKKDMNIVNCNESGRNAQRKVYGKKDIQKKIEN